MFNLCFDEAHEANLSKLISYSSIGCASHHLSQCTIGVLIIDWQKQYLLDFYTANFQTMASFNKQLGKYDATY